MLSAREIKRLVAAREIVIDPFDEDLLKPASYTFCLGGKLKRLKPASSIDSREKYGYFEELEIGPEGYSLHPGGFVICQTQEVLRLPRYIGCFLAMRGYLAQMGIDALQCEIFCEPGSQGGWDGKLMLEVSNGGPNPVRLFSGIKAIKAIFVRVQ